MNTVFVLTTNEALEESIDRYFKHIYDINIYSRSLRAPPESEDKPLEDKPLEDKPLWVWNSFQSVCNWMERAASEKDLRGSIAILDFNCFNHWCKEEDPSRHLADPFDLNLLERWGQPPWKSVAGMLVMAFPEVHWIFPGVNSPNTNFRFDEAHLLQASFPLQNLVQFHNQEFAPLFDPTDLRDNLRGNINQESEGNDPIPDRPRLAAALDEEAAYSYFNAYASYRFGYRTWSVTSWSMTERLFGNVGSSENNGERMSTRIEMLLEDLYCLFPDRPPQRHISRLRDRDERLPRLGQTQEIRRRFIVTSGHQRQQHRGQHLKENRQYLREWKGETTVEGRRRVAKIIQKPLGGIFDLWRKTGMWKWELWDWDGQPETATDFKWPREPTLEARRHSAPGRLLLIAERLIDRSKGILQEVKTVPEAVYAATLALEAKELLANRTPTTALEALALQHRAEVMAESMFHGVEFNLDVESRFDEIEREVEAIGRWFSGRRRKRVTLNARLAIIEDLAREFSELDQFEEERECRAEARRLYFDFWAHQSPWRLPFLPLLRYLSLSLRSLPVFFGLVAFWIVLFGVGYHILDPYVFGESRSFGEAFSTSTVYFFTLSMPPSWYNASKQVLWNSILAFQSVVSLSHLGILVSHIYLIISRR